MALGARGFVRIGATIAGCALVAACTPDQPPTVTPTPAASPTATPSPAPSATLTETDIERQHRLAFGAAEAAYRIAIAEGDRIAQAGGANEATPALKAVATGDYLKLQVRSLATLKRRGERLEGGITILAVKRDGGYQPTQVRLTACEDNSTWKLISRSGKDVTPKRQKDYVQSLVVVKMSAGWKVSDGTTRQVQDLSAKECT